MSPTVKRSNLEGEAGKHGGIWKPNLETRLARIHE